MRLWRVGLRGKDVEGLLRAHCPSPRPEFVEGLESRLGLHARRPRAWSRVAFATALTTVMLGAFASFGGLSYAAGRVDHGVHAVKTALTPSNEPARHVSQRSPAADEYTSPPPPTTPPAGGGGSGGRRRGGAPPGPGS